MCGVLAGRTSALYGEAYSVLMAGAANADWAKNVSRCGANHTQQYANHTQQYANHTQQYAN
eukprot:SAG11_NODE_8719_length_983_cov_1.811086_1_plen_60_part_10